MLVVLLFRDGTSYYHGGCRARVCTGELRVICIHRLEILRRSRQCSLGRITGLDRFEHGTQRVCIEHVVANGADY
jgi:hypothetical protein